jgi:hypothetical protein
MTNTKHTPTPWTSKGDQVIEDGEVVADCFQLPEGNAEFIVRAVNSHEALLDALMVADFHVNKKCGCWINGGPFCGFQSKIKKAIAQAEAQ